MCLNFWCDSRELCPTQTWLQTRHGRFFSKYNRPEPEHTRVQNLKHTFVSQTSSQSWTQNLLCGCSWTESFWEFYLYIFHLESVLLVPGQKVYSALKSLICLDYGFSPHFVSENEDSRFTMDYINVEVCLKKKSLQNAFYYKCDSCLITEQIQRISDICEVFSETDKTMSSHLINNTKIYSWSVCYILNL